jgi:hypothetical protein
VRPETPGANVMILLFWRFLFNLQCIKFSKIADNSDHWTDKFALFHICLKRGYFLNEFLCSKNCAF